MKNIGGLICILLSLHAGAQKSIRLYSPDGHIRFSFEQSNGRATYRVAFKNKIVIDKSELDLVFAEGRFNGMGLAVNKPTYRDTTEEYDLVAGKTSHVLTRYKEVTISLQQINGLKRKLHVIVRVFNDGLAFRYEFPQQPGINDLTLLEENTLFNLPDNPMVNTLFLANYTSSHEGFYNKLPLNLVKSDTLMDMPTLFEFSNGVYLGITEAALLDYAGMSLAVHNGVLTSRLSPLPNQNEIKVKANLPHHSPWRVLLISDRVGALIESNIITTLNEPCKIKDLSWIKPGKTTWTWWNGNITPDTTFTPGNNFDFNKYYIDFCATNGIEYHSVIEYGNKEWYTNDGNGFEPGPGVDVTKPVRSLDMKQICDYAKTKGVDIRVWVHWGALFPQPRLDSAFSALEKWGVKGLMIDFMDRDDQEMVNMQTIMLQKAAEHHLHVQFHGAYKPTGLSRTYPNEFTREGTLNYEADKWGPTGLNADHDINMPFTRMLAGPTDYHLGGFRAVPASSFKAQFTRPLVLSTRCHMLAMYVVLENYLGMVADYPDAYSGQPGFELIQKVPTVWDEAKVLDAKTGAFISIARRKQNDWYVGTITNHEARDIKLSMDFLGEGQYTAEIYHDAPDVATNPNHLIKEIKKISAKDSIDLHIAGGGGAVVYLRKE
jgi:alpha-glucosidase